ncbi:MoeA N-terminal region-like protein [Bimuria novae-zelandiae CBS 107.79]|uniref:molybdopterin adenylyltransferase n=1 Tax=Bimuria novae-zelandiae CBS 107.79 TaxID=1447943 RepID=A0A6A5V9D5_9PLEO|nr:MoeA N-terminal region-like protein [Bimuria novae-zelandiae CBS 107.79]
MAIRYSEALGILKQVAVEILEREDGSDVEYVGLEDAVGRIAGQHHRSTSAAPPFDVSAINGYILSSTATVNATKKRPVTFAVKGTIAAGNEPPDVPLSGSGIPFCFEIMAGARLPTYTPGDVLDSCVKLEDVVPTSFGSQRMITVVAPVAKNANRRAAGSDLDVGCKVLARGEKIRPRHVTALAAAGISRVAVRRKLSIAVRSPAYEPAHQNVARQSQQMDPGGHFLTATIRELGAKAKLMGGLKPHAESLSKLLQHEIQDNAYDLVLVSGADSLGTTDLTLSALKEVGARIRFHGVSIDPGHSVLFATLPTPHGEVPFLKLPNDPVAIAACFEFLVKPFIRQLSELHQDVPKIMKIQQTKGLQDLSKDCPPHVDCFRPGWIQQSDRGEQVMLLGHDHNPAKLSQYAASNCWAHVPRGHSGNCRNTLVYCYSHTST